MRVGAYGIKPKEYRGSGEIVKNGEKATSGGKISWDRQSYKIAQAAGRSARSNCQILELLDTSFLQGLPVLPIFAQVSEVLSKDLNFINKIK